MKNSALYTRIPAAIYKNALPIVVLKRFALKFAKSTSSEKNKIVAPIIIKKVVNSMRTLLKLLPDLSNICFVFIYMLSFIVN